MDDHKASDRVATLMEESLDRFNEVKIPYRLEADQPEHISWVIVDAHFQEFGIDNCTAIGYKDASEMRLELLRLAKEVFTAEILEFVRSGKVIDLTLRIGPNTLWNTNLNEDDDFEFEDNDVKESA